MVKVLCSAFFVLDLLRKNVTLLFVHIFKKIWTDIHAWKRSRRWFVVYHFGLGGFSCLDLLKKTVRNIFFAIIN